MKKLTLLLALLLSTALFSCSSGNNGKDDSKMDEKEFAESQPLESGTYDATYYDISGSNARKGHYDGRLMVSLSPEVSALYVYENGNRAKIDYLIMLEKPFEKGDSGIYKALDKEGKAVTIKKDSIGTLTFDKKESQIKIEFDLKPKSVQPAFDVLQRINDMKTK